MDSPIQVYSYRWSIKFLFYVLSVVLALLSLFLGVLLILKIITWFLGDSTDGLSIVGTIITLLIIGFCFALCSNAYPNVRVYDRGLKVQIFLFWWFFVPWRDVENIWTIGIFAKQYAVAVRKLTLFHRIIGLGYGSLKPVFPIVQTMSGYNELVQLIKQNIQKPDWVDRE